MSLLDIQQLSVEFGVKGHAFRAVDGLDLQLDQGEVLGIVGESGSGKSVAMMAMMGLLAGQGRVDAQRLNFDGQDLLTISDRQRRKILGKDMAMIFQDPMTSLNPCFTVGYQLEEVLREALARLQSMGLVNIQRGRGTFVGNRTSLANCVRLLRSAVTISPQELRSYAELRTAMEVQAARQAAELATDEEVAELEELLKQLDDEDLPYAEALELDFAFHRKLIDIAGNPLMQNMIEVIYEFVLTQMVHTTPSQRENALGRKLHKAILRAVRDHDPDAAAEAMQRHMQAVLDRLAKETP